MSEKTAEEKLRQALEGSITDSNKHETSQGRSKPKPRTRARSATSRKEMPENLGQRVDSFMDDFERMIEQSLSAVKSPSVSQEKPKPSRKSTAARRKPSTEIPIVPEKEQEPAIIPETPVTQEREPQPEIIPAQEQQPDTLPETPITPEPSQALPDIPPIEPEILPEVEPIEPEPEPELPDIPVIEADFSPVREPAHNDTENDSGLPDIPVITSDDDDADFDDFADDFTDDDEQPQHDEPETETKPEFQEAELLEAPEIVDDFTPETEADFDDFSDEPIDEEPEHVEPDDYDAEPYDIDADEAGIFADDEPGELEPPADVVLNVDDELPQISAQNEPDVDPEAESAPVTVTMPETTKTAEDKLMADIAEAMTGNPLSLDTEQPGLYNIPENFFTDDANPEASPQSAEDKLKANIAQALSESPINTAQDQASQNLEDDINPFDDMDLPDSLMSFGDDENEPEQDDLTQDDDSPFDSETESEPELDAVPENEPENDNEEALDPFTIPDFPDDDDYSQPETESEIDSFPETEPESDIEPLSDFELDPEFEPAPELIPDIESIPELEPETEPQPDEPDEPFTADEALLPESEPLTEQDRLTQEIAAMTQEFDTAPEPEQENMTPDNEPEFDIDATNEEAQQDNDMPEQTLLNDGAEETFSDGVNDDWNIADLGELGAAATLADDDGDDFSMSGPEPQDFTSSAGIINNDEHKETEKTVNIREKLASRKNAGSDDAPAPKKKSSGSGGGGILMPLLLGLLIAIGGMILWQLMQMSDKITSLAMNSTGYESVSGVEANPSYDYAIDFILDPNLADRMRQRGRDGWQVVGSRRTQDSTTGQYGYELIFMRRTPGR